jgi:hypothetical protein
MDIETVWKRIAACEGQTFSQIRGKKYTYEISGTSLIPEGINQNLSKSQFEQALRHLPLQDTTEIQHLRGPSYLYSILMDPRIRGGDDWGSGTDGRR